jgi:hypothetical protein
MSGNGLFTKATPTLTPTLTPTIVPTITPTSTLTPDEEIALLYYYLNTRIEKLVECQNSAQLFSDELGKIGNDQYALVDPGVIEDINSVIFNFDLYCTNLSASNAPVLFSIFNAYLEKASENYQLSVDNLRLGIDQMDVDYINIASIYLNKGTEYINLAANELNKY